MCVCDNAAYIIYMFCVYIYIVLFKTKCKFVCTYKTKIKNILHYFSSMYYVHNIIYTYMLLCKSLSAITTTISCLFSYIYIYIMTIIYLYRYAYAIVVFFCQSVFSEILHLS